MHAFSRIARESAGRIAGLGATTGAYAASRGPAQARPATQRPSLSLAQGPCQDDWLITHLDSGNVFFHPEDIDEVANEVLQLVPRQSAVCYNASDSEGQEATSVIELSDFASSSSASRCTPAGDPYSLLTRVASELLKRPGVQQQVLDVILDDPELLAVLGDKQNMSNYLALWGVSSSGLLPPATVVEDVTEACNEAQAGTAVDASPIDKLLARIFMAFDQMGGAMHRVGNWLRASFNRPKTDADESSTDSNGGSKAELLNSFAGNPLVKSAVMVAVGVVCVLLLRRPQVLAALISLRAVRTAAAFKP